MASAVAEEGLSLSVQAHLASDVEEVVELALVLLEQREQRVVSQWALHQTRHQD